MDGVTGTPLEPNSSAKKPNFEIPKGYENEDTFLSEMRHLFDRGVTQDFHNRLAGSEDIAFMIGDQWPIDERKRREEKLKPVMTINRLPAFVAQVIGSRRMNETQIKIVPDVGGKREVAEIREALVRNLQKQSNAKFVYDSTLLGSVLCGIGNFQIEMDYESDDVFDQTARLAPILDNFATVWDPGITDQTGRDAGYCFVIDTMNKDVFKSKWPWATPADLTSSVSTAQQMWGNGWYIVDNVRVVDYWRMRTRKVTLVMLQNGNTIVLDDMPAEKQPEYLAQAMTRPDGSPVMREVNKKYAERYVCSGNSILEGPYRLDISRIPVFRVPGWEVRLGERTYRWGLIRFMKDPQRLHNFWRSVVAERAAKSPRNTWVASDAAVAGREKAWRESHMSDDPLLIWNSESGERPQREDPVQMEMALMQQAEMSNQDLKDVSNIHEANLGMPSNEVSGAAIRARQNVSDTGTIIYHDNLKQGVEEAGRVFNELIPIIFDAPRIIKVTNEDDQDTIQAINGMTAEAHDITAGKYSVTVTTGPDSVTKRAENSQNMLGLASAMPQIMSVAADLIVLAQDWPNAPQIADRIKRAMPPQILGPQDMTPDMMQRMQGQAQQAQAEQHSQMLKDFADFMLKQSQAQLNSARSQHYGIQSETGIAQARTGQINALSNAAHRAAQDHIAALKV